MKLKDVQLGVRVRNRKYTFLERGPIVGVLYEGPKMNRPNITHVVVEKEPDQNLDGSYNKVHEWDRYKIFPLDAVEVIK
ncbi:hypothetical protein MOV08_05375 [Streptomyces yunnanensis]|uniref:Uncharacterized protein n=1 Tax=Streptomyces yunnanensis TaxID=156453 RepID=A0ABY8A516_9ACTN|nr:hypothetical protein [Streptomyces yunnanensis]WEB38792.1 hypothetical protein MOV08_05375 [Streptomyces yunnanensis]